MQACKHKMILHTLAISFGLLESTTHTLTATAALPGRELNNNTRVTGDAVSQQVTEDLHNSASNLASRSMLHVHEMCKEHPLLCTLLARIHMTARFKSPTRRARLRPRACQHRYALLRLHPPSLESRHCSCVRCPAPDHGFVPSLPRSGRTSGSRCLCHRTAIPVEAISDSLILLMSQYRILTISSSVRPLVSGNKK